MSDRDNALRLVHAHLTAAAVLIDALMAAPTPAEDEPAGAEGCPNCHEPEKFEDTSVPGASRMTCLSCGKSWTPAEVSLG